MTIDCDILVVGGGPAGLATSIFLANEGLNVVILEKNKNIVDKPLKIDITEGNRIKKIIDELELTPNKISNKSEWISSDNTYVLESKIKDYYFLRGNSPTSIESKLYSTLKEKKDNVKIFFNTNINEIKTRENHIEQISTNNKNIRPKKIIFAEGHSSKFEQDLGIPAEKLVTFIGYGVMFRTSEKNLIPHSRIYFNERIAPGGYIYSSSIENESFVCIVIDKIFLSKINIKKNLNHFINNNFRNISITNYFYGEGISGLKYALKNNIYLIGGNAYFHDPFFGYGLNYSIESGYFVAKSIIQENKNIYEDYIKNIHDEIKSLYFAREIWRKANQIFFDDLISKLNGSSNSIDKDVEKIISLFQD